MTQAGLAVSENDRRFCWEQVLKVNPLFRMTQTFAHPAERDRLLPLHALFSSIEQICSSVVDEEVARRKLDWWRMETLHTDPAASAHPVLKLLAAQGAARYLHKSALASLFDCAEQRLDATAPTDHAQLMTLCCDIYAPQLQLELALLADGVNELTERGIVGRGGLLQLLRESLARRNAAFWWVPLPLLARHGVNRPGLMDSRQSTAARAVFAEIFERATAWGPHYLPYEAVTGKHGHSPRHVFVTHAVNARKIDRLRRTPPGSLRREVRRGRPAELMTGWQAARNHARGA